MPDWSRGVVSGGLGWVAVGWLGVAWYVGVGLVGGGGVGLVGGGGVAIWVYSSNVVLRCGRWALVVAGLVLLMWSVVAGSVLDAYLVFVRA